MTKNKIIEQSRLTESRMKCDSFSSTQQGLQGKKKKKTGLTLSLLATHAPWADAHAGCITHILGLLLVL